MSCFNALKLDCDLLASRLVGAKIDITKGTWSKKKAKVSKIIQINVNYNTRLPEPIFFIRRNLPPTRSSVVPADALLLICQFPVEIFNRLFGE